MGKSTISMAIFHSFLYVHQRVRLQDLPGDTEAELNDPEAFVTWQFFPESSRWILGEKTSPTSLDVVKN